MVVRIKHIDGLGDLVCISQILPISFTLSLAFLAVSVHTEQDKDSRRPQEQRKVTTSTSGGTSSAVLQTAIVGALLCALATVPNLQEAALSRTTLARTSEKPALMPLVLFIRMLLATPFFTESDSSRSTMPLLLLAIGGAALQTIETAKLSAIGGPVIRTLLDEVFPGHPSAKTFGQDAVLALIGIGVWNIV